MCKTNSPLMVYNHKTLVQNNPGKQNIFMN